MSQILTPGERPTQWGTAGDHDRRIRALEAVDPCACDDTDTFAEVILANPCLLALWKLNDAGGDIAFDSGPGGFDQNSGSYDPPLWQQEASPAGDPSAFFEDNLGESLASFAALTGDFSALILFNRADQLHGSLIGQGAPATNTAGWKLSVGAFNEGAHNRPKVFIGTTSGGPNAIEADDEVLEDDWTMVGMTRESEIWTLYVNGVAQSTTFDDNGTLFTSATGIWIGNNPSDVAQTTNFHGLLSYGAVFDCALSVEEWEELEAALRGIPSGWVWTMVDGVPMWQPPGGGGGGITEITSTDTSITVTDPTGPTVDLAISLVDGGSP